MGNKKIIGGIAVAIGIIMLATNGLPLMSVLPIESGFTFVSSISTPNIEIHGKSFVASRPKVSCEYLSPKIPAGQPQANCWSVNVSFSGEDYNIVNGNGATLNEFMHVDYNAGGFIRTDGKAEYWSNGFTLHNTKPFLIANVGNKLVEFKDKDKLQISVKNLWEEGIGGLFVEYTTEIIKEQNSQFFNDIHFKKGDNSYALELNKQTPLGVTSVRVTPYYYINIGDATTKIMQQPSGGSVYVVPKIGNVDTSVDCSNKQCPSGYECVDYKTAKICEKESLHLNDFQETESKESSSSFALFAMSILLIVGGAYIALK